MNLGFLFRGIRAGFNTGHTATGFFIAGILIFIVFIYHFSRCYLKHKKAKEKNKIIHLKTVVTIEEKKTNENTFNGSEFPRDQLILGDTLKEDAFSRIIAAKAIFLNGNEHQHVAVKMIKSENSVLKQRNICIKINWKTSKYYYFIWLLQH